MKFTVIEDPCIKTTVGTLEKGNTHDSDVIGLPENECDALHKAGFISIEGREDGKRDPSKKIILEPAKMKASLGVKSPK